MTKSLETLIREWQNTLESLVNKVSALEARIGEQNSKISEQHQLIVRLGSMTGPSLASSPVVRPRTSAAAAAAPAPPAPPALQRPIRQARITAGLALSGNKCMPKKSTATIAQPTVATNNAPKTPDTTQLSSENRLPKDAATKSLADIDTTQTPVVTLMAADIIPQKLDHENEWKTVSHKKTRSPRQPINVGVGKEDSELQTVERLKYLQAWSFKPETSKINILNYLNRVMKSDNYYVEKRVLKSDKHAAFIIGVPESMFERMNSPAAWPPGVRFSGWFLARPRAERGAPPAVPAVPAADCSTSRAKK
ncbi:hypothetical protein JYU34_015244 [Plutella xylostella]|uniref:Uncharacterized protein n=1 Tax=Plutella xylostella TaxID=51655 RepID=A0ABQ7Q6P8_PLUXY|nr:hypothetical protein JYU34_015244 [Plutella xylostella]